MWLCTANQRQIVRPRAEHEPATIAALVTAIRTDGDGGPRLGPAVARGGVVSVGGSGSWGRAGRGWRGGPGWGRRSPRSWCRLQPRPWGRAGRGGAWRAWAV